MTAPESLALSTLQDALDGDARAADLRKTKLGLRTKLLYGLGALIDGVTATSLTYFLFFYLTSVCGLSGTLAGLSTMLALVLDSVVDPAIGIWSDSARSKWGRRVPFLVVTPAPIGILFVMLFSIPASLAGMALFGYATIVAMALRMAMSAYGLPYLAAGAELTDDYADRTSIVSYRIAFQMVGALVAIALGLGVFMAGDAGVLNRQAYVPFAATCAVLIAIAGMVSALAVKRELPRLHRTPVAVHGGIGQFFKELSEVFRNRSFVTLFCAVLLYFVGQGAGGALALHYNRYFWDLPSAAVQAVIVPMTLGPFIGAPINVILSRLIEKRTLTIANLLLFPILLTWPAVLRIFDLLPHAQGTIVLILATNGFITGAVLVGAAIGFQSMLADAADEHEFLFGVRREGLFFSGLTLALKAASGLGAMVAGLALDFIHFPTELAAQSGQLQLTPAVVRGLGIVGGPVPAAITLLAPMMLFGYALTKSKHAAILADLTKRRGQ